VDAGDYFLLLQVRAFINSILAKLIVVGAPARTISSTSVLSK